MVSFALQFSLGTKSSACFRDSVPLKRVTICMKTALWKTTGIRRREGSSQVLSQNEEWKKETLSKAAIIIFFVNLL